MFHSATAATRSDRPDSDAQSARSARQRKQRDARSADIPDTFPKKISGGKIGPSARPSPGRDSAERTQIGFVRRGGSSRRFAISLCLTLFCGFSRDRRLGSFGHFFRGPPLASSLRNDRASRRARPLHVIRSTERVPRFRVLKNLRFLLRRSCRKTGVRGWRRESRARPGRDEGRAFHGQNNARSSPCAGSAEASPSRYAGRRPRPPGNAAPARCRKKIARVAPARHNGRGSSFK